MHKQSTGSKFDLGSSCGKLKCTLQMIEIYFSVWKTNQLRSRWTHSTCSKVPVTCSCWNVDCFCWVTWVWAGWRRLGCGLSMTKSYSLPSFSADCPVRNAAGCSGKSGLTAGYRRSWTFWTSWKWGRASWKSDASESCFGGSESWKGSEFVAFNNNKTSILFSLRANYVYKTIFLNYIVIWKKLFIHTFFTLILIYAKHLPL